MREPRNHENKQLDTTTSGAEPNIIFQVQAYVYKFSSNWFDRFTLVNGKNFTYPKT